MRNRFLFLVIMAVWGNSCTVIKNIKDKNALNRVKANINLLNDAGNDWQKLNPCTIDTGVSFIKGDTLITYDTTYSYLIHHDTVTNVDLKTKIVTVTKKIHDTTRVVVTDKRAVESLTGQLNTLQGKYDQQTTQVTSISKSQKKTSLWLIGILIFSFIIITGLTYLLFRK